VSGEDYYRAAAEAEERWHEQLGDLVVTTMSNIAPERIEWLWPGRIPRGKLTVVEGDPKVGKSTLMLDLIARVTTGSPMPDSARLPAPAHCVLLTAEDGLADTVRPRLDAAGGDSSRVHVWEAVLATDDGGRTEMRPPTIPLDLVRLEHLVDELGAELVVVDVLAAYLGAEIDDHKNHDVRRALMPLAKMAERAGAAVVVLRHLNKSGGENALYRGGGSIGITGTARSILLAATDPGDDTGTRRVLAVTACNVAAPVPALAYQLVPDEMRDCARIVWEGTSDLTSRDLLANPARAEERSERSEIEELLSAWTAAGPIAVEEAKRRLHSDGYSPSSSTLTRAARHAGVKVGKPEGFGGKRSYYQPAQSRHPNGSACGDETVAPLLNSTDDPSGSAVPSHNSVMGQDTADLVEDPNSEAVDMVMHHFPGAQLVEPDE
jgi:hypothetical protein